MVVEKQQKATIHKCDFSYAIVAIDKIYVNIIIIVIIKYSWTGDNYPVGLPQERPAAKCTLLQQLNLFIFVSSVRFTSGLVNKLLLSSSVFHSLHSPGMCPCVLFIYLFIYLFNSGCEAHTTTKYTLPIDGDQRNLMFFFRQTFYGWCEKN